MHMNRDVGIRNVKVFAPVNARESTNKAGLNCTSCHQMLSISSGLRQLFLFFPAQQASEGGQSDEERQLQSIKYALPMRQPTFR